MNIFNTKTIILLSISTLMMNGCIAKNTLTIQEEKKDQKKVTFVIPKIKVANSWGKVKGKNLKKDDCIDCYATPIKSPMVLVASKSVPKKPIQKIEKYVGSYAYNVEPKEYIQPAITYVNTAQGNYSTHTNVAIQVGAFSRYKGAKIYKKRYNALSNRYKVTIKTGSKNNRPLHRVRIEGFSDRTEAKIFMNRYGIRNGFIVRK